MIRFRLLTLNALINNIFYYLLLFPTGVAIYNSLTISSYTAGETLVISCNITSTAVPVVSWIHRNVSLFENNRITIINNTEQSLSVDTVSVISTLIITELELADDGLYKCQAIDESFKAEENIAIVSIDGKLFKYVTS